jgi:phosphoribosylformimino-5-aminoimidazole carboxamide ribotide isomerase
MHLYARVNILDGKAVRLPHGNISEVIHLDADPLERAKGWVAKGADRLHVVDLDAAAHGDYRNRALIADLIEALDVPVSVGGGVRSAQGLQRLLDAGADKVVMGTVAVIDQVLFWELCREHPGRIVVALDVRPDEELAIHGWTTNSGQYLEEALIELSSAGAAGFMIAEAGRDALEEPLNIMALKRALTIVDEPVVAAGGVRDFDELRELKALEVDGKRLAGVVVGREVTAGRFTVEDAAGLLRRTGPPSGPWSIDELRAQVVRFRDELGETQSAEDFVNWLGAG